jgi:hypothetical protein
MPPQGEVTGWAWDQESAVESLNSLSSRVIMGLRPTQGTKIGRDDFRRSEAEGSAFPYDPRSLRDRERGLTPDPAQGQPCRRQGRIASGVTQGEVTVWRQRINL